MREDPDYHRKLLDGGDDLQLAAALRAVFEVDIEHALEQAHAVVSCAWRAASLPGFSGVRGTIAARSPAWGASTPPAWFTVAAWS